ncbi:MAG: N-acetylneuraminate synthase [Eubacteriales bacterium]|nr:N-acetylneuraminate synthase [Eubacteriales bacterium]
MSKTFIIAEVGVNHNGDMETAKQLISRAKQAGADAVKFQTFIADNLVSKFALKADYQVKNTDAAESSKSMLRKLEISYDGFRQLKKVCDQEQICFLSTPFDMESVEFLAEIGMRYWKIPSGEITNLPYLIKIANTHMPVIMSTGMCTIDEIGTAIAVLKEHGTGEVSLLHCTTEYPAPYEDVNLVAMKTLRDKFRLQVGYSDHTKGIEVAIAAVALGATMIEKHLTLDKNMTGPDHKASLEPAELAEMVSAIRNIEAAIGDGVKRPMPAELKNMAVARKSIIAKTPISAGDVFTESNITVKRPGNGISPMKWFEVLGKTAGRDFQEDELIQL